MLPSIAHAAPAQKFRQQLRFQSWLRTKPRRLDFAHREQAGESSLTSLKFSTPVG